MAVRLLAAGYSLTIWARRPEATHELARSGARVADSPASVAHTSDVVVALVTRDEDLEEITLGQNGLREGFVAGSVLLVMCTVAPATIARLGAALHSAGVRIVDAPVSGGPAAAAAGNLAIMVGGEPDDLARVRPVLEVLGQRITPIGPSGAGQAAKLCNQMIMLATMQGVAEGLALADAAGVNLAAVRQAMLGGSAGSKVLDVFGQRMIDRHYADGVESRLHHKDFGLILDELKANNLGAPLTALVAAQLNALQASGRAHDDTASLIELLRREKTL
jgi:2-hydroxy-3-oxopropionate reductase